MISEEICPNYSPVLYLFGFLPRLSLPWSIACLFLLELSISIKSRHNVYYDAPSLDLRLLCIYIM